MRDVDSIIIVIELQSKGKTAIIPSEFALHVVGVVAYFSTLTHPSYSLSHRSLLGVDQRLHAYVVEAVWFEQVDDVEPILYIFSGVGDREEVPLGVSVCVVVSR